MDSGAWRVTVRGMEESDKAERARMHALPSALPNVTLHYVFSFV